MEPWREVALWHLEVDVSCFPLHCNGGLSSPSISGKGPSFRHSGLGTLLSLAMNLLDMRGWEAGRGPRWSSVPVFIK